MLSRCLQSLGAAFLIALAPQCSDEGGKDDAAAVATGGRTPTTGGATNTGGAPSSGGRPASTTGGAPPPSGGTTSDAGADQGGVAGSGEGAYWEPEAGLTWQWQLSESLGEPLDVDVYDIDWEADASHVARLHARGIKVICYVSVGSWEDFRPDSGDFADAVIGNDYDGWPGEKYVDIRAESLREIMLRRFDACRDKGFDAIEPDNMDVFELGDDSGFPLTREDGLDYARFLAVAAHERGLGIGQKNASSLTREIAPLYQWALTESCYSDGNWCDDLQPYLDANKPVFMCEYDAGDFDAACEFGVPRRYSPILKDLDLDAEVTFCE